MMADIPGTILADSLLGTAGDDFMNFDPLNRNQGTDGNDGVVGLDGNDTLLGGNGNDVLDGNKGNDKLSGQNGNDILIGGDGNDWLDGGTGGDRMDGGYGDDTYFVDNVGDVVIDSTITNPLFGGGFDKVHSSITYQLGTGIEDLYLKGYNAINGIGNYQDNTIWGNYANNVLWGEGGYDTLWGDAGQDTLFGGLGNDVLSGGGGVDVLYGGGGNDTYDYDMDDQLIEDYEDPAIGGVDTVNTFESATLGAGLDNLRLLIVPENGFNVNFNGTGNSLNNIITGTIGDNTLSGLAGNDTLYGMEGGDILNGGDGDDTLDGGHGNDQLNGYEGNDTLLGGAGNDRLDGQGGDDIMDGGGGNDTYIVQSFFDVVAETKEGAGGVDRVESAVTHHMRTGIENLTLIGTQGVNGVGNELNNVMAGNTSDNMLSGLAGNDTLDGGAGTDILDGGIGVDTVSYQTATVGVTVNLGLTTVQNTVGAGTDTLSNLENLKGSNFNDTLTGNAGNNSLTGGNGHDILNGGAGNDTLIGGLGLDTLTGGIGNDVFDYNAVNESLVGTSRDKIIGFAGAGTAIGDQIDLTTIDANGASAGNGTFVWINGAAFSGTNATGQLRYSGGILQGSTDADAAAEFEIQVVGTPAISVGGAGSDILL